MIVFASAIGQWDNVGDTVLRRAYLDALRSAGQLHVYVGSQTDDQLGGLGVQPQDTLIRSSAEWRAALSSRIGREPVLYGFDSGETELQRRFAQRYLRLAPLLLANRLRGGHAVLVGVGVRESTSWRLPVRAALRTVDIVAWRDAHSRSIMGLGSVTPDWAFGLGADADALQDDSTARPVLAIAIRASLPHAPRDEPDAAWADRAGALADRLGLQPVFVAQIGRDGPLAARLADRIGAESLLWETPDHATFEARLRSLYRRSAVVLSDRLHGLIIGATEGAVPVPLAAAPLDKSTRTLAAVGIQDIAVSPGLDDDAGARILAAVQRRQEIASAVIGARQRLTSLRAEIVALTEAQR